MTAPFIRLNELYHERLFVGKKKVRLNELFPLADFAGIQLSMKKQANEQLVAVIQQRIRERMQALNLSQAQLAEDAEVSKSGLNEVLNKNRAPGADFLLKIAQRLGVSVDYLLGGEPKGDAEGLWEGQDVVEMIRAISALSGGGKARVKDLIEKLKAEGESRTLSEP